MLDFQVWAEEEDAGLETGTKTRLMFEFYEKPIASKLVIMEKRAKQFQEFLNYTKISPP